MTIDQDAQVPALHRPRARRGVEEFDQIVETVLAWDDEDQALRALEPLVNFAFAQFSPLPVEFWVQATRKLQAAVQSATESEPDRQRTLMVACVRVGDLLGVRGSTKLSRTCYAQARAIAERLAEREPDRADYQWDLVVSLLRRAEYDPDNARGTRQRALDILLTLQAEGRLVPVYAEHIPTIEWMLDALP